MAAATRSRFGRLQPFQRRAFQDAYALVNQIMVHSPDARTSRRRESLLALHVLNIHTKADPRTKEVMSSH